VLKKQLEKNQTKLHNWNRIPSVTQRWWLSADFN